MKMKKDNMKLSESDYAIMNIIWDKQAVSASEIAEKLSVTKGWKKPTVYTLIDRLVKKGAVKRSENDYICTAVVEREDVRIKETQGLLEKLYNGSAKLLVSGFIKDKRLTEEELEELKNLIEEMSGDNTDLR